MSYVYATTFFPLIELAWKITDPSEKAARLHNTCGQLKWESYPFVFVPVSGRDHWSFITVENALQSGPTNRYHVNSLKGAHDTGYTFETLKWFLVQEQKRQASKLPPGYGVFNTKPPQTNTGDCGLYVYQ